jgi:hypothetical protein
VPLDGSSKSEAVTRSTAFQGFLIGAAELAISPSGEILAYGVSQEGKPKIALLNLNSSSSPQLVGVNPNISGALQFQPDGKAIAYPIREKGVDNLWVQPLDGRSDGHQITNFNSEFIFSFRWSPDGKSIGLLRGHYESDVVLLHDSGSSSN